MSSNIFNKVQVKRPKTSTFDLSYDTKFSCKMGYLIPVHLQECVPGDKFRMASEAMFRLMPMVAPIMHRVDVFMHFFFVPNRILWPNWERWITGGETYPTDLPTPQFPVMNYAEAPLNYVQVSSLGDYLGIPTHVDLGQAMANHTGISAIPFAGYQRIWHEYYRDENLQLGLDELPIELTDGPQSPDQHDLLIRLRKRAWEHDYFTSCLPFAQKGEAVTIPIDFAGDPVNVDLTTPTSGPFPYMRTPGGPAVGSSDLQTDSLGYITDGTQQLRLDPNDTLSIDPDDLQGTATINDLRSAWALQRWMEKNARAGSRYTESIWAHFNVQSPDKRLQRPEYLGGSRSQIAISEVLQTSATEVEGGTSATPQGNMAGHGISVNGGQDFTYYCQEHGYIHGILSIRPKTAYQQGLDRHWWKTTDPTQYAWPDFAALGEQAVLNGEVYLDANSNQNDNTFGYIPRYAEYRFNNNRVAGQFRSTLNYWHMGRIFETRPHLNENFIQADPTKRIFAVTDPNEDEVIAHVFHKIRATRPLPMYGTPI